MLWRFELENYHVEIASGNSAGGRNKIARTERTVETVLRNYFAKAHCTAKILPKKRGNLQFALNLQFDFSQLWI